MTPRKVMVSKPSAGLRAFAEIWEVFSSYNCSSVDHARSIDLARAMDSAGGREGSRSSTAT